MADTPTRYTPTFIQSIVDGARSVRMNLEQASKTNHESTSSFFYDVPGSGLKSSQQVNVDWSRFENHTFFNSAEVNVNIAFDRIINSYPFDGTKKEHEVFFEGLSGFEKWVYDVMPKNVGYLLFSGSLETQNGISGTHISVKDYAGSLYPELSKLKSGQRILDPGDSSWSVEMHVYVPAQSNSASVIVQRIVGDDQGYTYYLKPTSSLGTVESQFVVTSGSFFMSASVELSKGQFNHVCLVYNKEGRFHKLQTFLESVLRSESITSVVMDPLIVSDSTLNIGSGSRFYAGDSYVTPTTTFSGALDELRFFHSIRTSQTLAAYAKKSVYASDDLKLYFKFNEPYGLLAPTTSDSVNRIVLDSSGNSLHSLIDEPGFTFSLRSTGSVAPPLSYERIDLSPVLFTTYADVSSLNQSLLSSASAYDAENPNLITKLVPQHYLVDGQSFDGFETQQGTIGEEYTSTSIPGSGKMGSSQIMLTFLYIWAKFFDELKIYVDAFSKIHYVDYYTDETAPDTFLPYLFKWSGFKIPSLFLDASIEQYVDSENIEFQISRGADPLKSIQNQILRRTLVSMGSIIRSKGTQRSIKSFLRTVGLDPDNSFRIREFGGPTERPLTFSREEKIEPGSWLDVLSSSQMISPFLTASRLEPGFPDIRGSFVDQRNYPPHGISDDANDGLLTSGSWTYESIYRFPLYKTIVNLTQSLARMEVTGTNTTTSAGGIIFNLVATSGTLAFPTQVILYGRPSSATSSSQAPVLKLTVDADIFDGNRWNVSFGRLRGDAVNVYNSSSYYLRAASSADDVRESTAWFRETGTESSTTSSSLENFGVSETNVSGSYLKLGSGSYSFGSDLGTYIYLNNTTVASESAARANVFEGQITQMRFWSKAFELEEWKEHVRNFKSLGVKDPLKNFNFNRTRSGSFERLRIDVSMRQPDVLTDAQGNLMLFDYSQNELHMSGTSFVTSSSPFISDLFKYSMISPYFDEASTNEKVRVRSYQDFDKVSATPWAEVAPVYRLNPSDRPTDNTRFSIEFSLVDALNRDIISIFSSLDSLDNVIGNPELQFSPDYPGLENLRDIYFQRLTDKLNFKSFFEFFRWFEQSIGTFIDQLIPRKTRYFGTNFVIESHMLERPKFEHLNNEPYLGESDRNKNKSTILLQQVVGVVKRY